jgi:4'-phosphopantetheinyl transferase
MVPGMLAKENLWSCPLTNGHLLPGDVQVWAGWLDVTGEAVSGLWSTLSAPEQERANRFIRQQHHARFVVARGMLREILGACLGTEPRKVEFGYGATGKPLLSGPFAASGVQFNLAHSGGLAAFAVARDRPVGVDVEQLRKVPELPQLIERFFSARECAAVSQLSAEEQTRAFFRLWTRKEAWLKATGEGMSGLLKTVEVLGPPGGLEVRAKLPGGEAETRLSLLDLAPAPGFLGALALGQP